MKPAMLCRYDEQRRLLLLSTPGASRPKALDPRIVRKNDTSAKSMNEWTGACLCAACCVPALLVAAAQVQLTAAQAQLRLWVRRCVDSGH